MALSRCILEALRDAELGDTACVGVGCSGGPDSAALAHAAMCLSAAGALGPVLLVHIDHQLRADSGDDARVIERLAAGGDDRVEVIVAAVRVDRQRASLEQAARDARYRAFERIIAARSTQPATRGSRS